MVLALTLGKRRLDLIYCYKLWSPDTVPIAAGMIWLPVIERGMLVVHSVMNYFVARLAIDLQLGVSCWTVEAEVDAPMLHVYEASEAFDEGIQRLDMLLLFFEV